MATGHTHNPQGAARDGRRRVALVSIGAAIALIALKLGAGIASGSLGLLAEALHSAADLVAAVLTYVAVIVGQRPPDRSHPWGHGRAENLAALFESLLLIGALSWIGVTAVRRLISGHSEVEVSTLTFVVMGLVIVIDVWRTWASTAAAREHESPALASNALHFASDLAGSIAVLVGLVASAAGFPAGDALAALVVVLIVAWSAWRLLWDNAQILMDVAPEGAERLATRAVGNLDLPITLKRLRIRRSSGTYLADIVIGVSAIEHVSQGHALADEVERAVHEALPNSDVVVHVEPETSRSLRERVTAAALQHHGVYEVHNVRVLLLEGAPEASLHVKVRPDMRLDSAHDLADLIERSIREQVPDITHVDVHIEPIDTEASVADAVDDDRITLTVRRVVRELTRLDPTEVRIRSTDGKLTAYVTVLADAAISLRDAHSLATRVEQRICHELPSISDVVVHTEPAPAQLDG